MCAKSSDIEEYLDFNLEHILGVFEVGGSINNYNKLIKQENCKLVD